MAQFRGTIQGQRGEASRLGTKSSGLRVEAASWSGKIVVELRHDAKSGKDYFEVRQEKHHGQGFSAPIAKGYFGEAPDEFKAFYMTELGL